MIAMVFRLDGLTVDEIAELTGTTNDYITELLADGRRRGEWALLRDSHRDERHARADEITQTIQDATTRPRPWTRDERRAQVHHLHSHALSCPEIAAVTGLSTLDTARLLTEDNNHDHHDHYDHDGRPGIPSPRHGGTRTGRTRAGGTRAGGTRKTPRRRR